MNKLGLFACTVIVFAYGTCAFAQDKDDIFADADSARAKAIDAQAEILSPISFSKAEKGYNRSVAAFKSGKSASRYSKPLNQAVSLYREALRNAEASTIALAEPLASRAAAVAVNAPELAVKIWADAEKSFKAAARSLEQGRSDTGMRSARSANSFYRKAELVAIKDSVMSEARSLLAGAKRLRVERSAPQTLSRAEELLAAANDKIEEDRYVLEEPQRLAAEAGYEARHAMHIAEKVKELKDGSLDSEGLILLLEKPLQRLADAANINAGLDEGYDTLTGQLESRLTNTAGLEKQIRELTEERDTIKSELASEQSKVAELEGQLAGGQGAIRDELAREKNRVAALEEELAQMDELLIAVESGRQNESSTGAAVAEVDALFSSDEALVFQSSSHIILRLVGLVFDSSSSQLPPGNPAVEKLVQVFALFPGSQVTIEGHTDSSGGAEENRRLSQARADSLLKYIELDMGVTGIAFRAIGYGDTRPVANNDTVAGRAQNRRIDVVILPGK